MSETHSRKALESFEQSRETWLEELKILARIPSISFEGFPAEEVARSAEAVRDLLQGVGLKNVEVLKQGDAHPYVYGDWLHAPGAPTVLLYAHHDVQPPLREELWHTPVFEPTERDGRVFARGIADDKAGILVHAAAIACWLRSEGRLPVNVKVLIEGEEEIGSPNLEAFLAQHAGKLKVDGMVLTDLANIDTGLPCLTTTLRGLVTVDITVSALDHALHSGMWGGPLPDPTMGLSKALAALVDKEGKPCIPGIWDEVLPPTAQELQDLDKLDVGDEKFRNMSGILDGVPLRRQGREILLALWREPSLVINSMEAAGRKIAGNVLMNEAWARVGLRIVPNMDPHRSLRLLKKALEDNLPWGLKAEIRPDTVAAPWMTRPEHPWFPIAKRALTLGYGREAVFTGCGGTIPFVHSFTRALGELPALLVGIEDPYTNAHSENESLHIEDFYRSIRSQIHFFGELGATVR